VACTAAVGLSALTRGLIEPFGLASCLPRFAHLGLAEWKDFILGGHEIRDVRMFDEAMRLWTESRAIDGELISRVRPDLDRIDNQVRPGTLHNVGPTIESFATDAIRGKRESARSTIERVQEDFRQFVKGQRLAHLIVVNVASTEPPFETAGLPARYGDLKKLLDRRGACPLPASSLYAIAAMDLGCSYVNFTPSTGSSLAALDDLARERGTRHMGYDGKTGETLLKSTLAPMFARRGLKVLSWVGHNIFGNMDGKVLDDPLNKKAKVKSKDRLLGQILKYQPQTLVSIEYIESLGDWKTAWDHVHFKGFLGTPMTFQFIWQGCDSLLAAPLVLDLVRFTERAWRAGEVGQMPFLACYFKSPLGVDEHDFTLQFAMLEKWADRIAAGSQSV
jgi:myo-inositol-1-phosphate synthase